MKIAVIEQRLHQERDAAGLEHVLGDVAAGRLEVGDIGRARQHLGDREQVEVDAAFIGDGRQVQRGIGRAAGRRNHGSRILERLAGDDVARADVESDQVHDLLAGGVAEAVPDLVGRGRAGGIRQRQTDGLGHGGHGVGGELGAAGAGRRTGDLLELGEILGRHLADGELADRLEQILHRHRAAPEGARKDGAAVDEDRRHVEAAHGHHHAGKRLVAAGHADERVIAMAADGELDGIGDHLAGRQRGLHALMAHGDAVGDGDGAELARRAAGGGHALLHGLGLAHQRDVARRGLVPAGGDADEGLMDLLGGQTHGIVIGAMGRAGGTLGDVPARQTRLIERLGVHLRYPDKQ